VHTEFARQAQEVLVVVADEVVVEASLESF
jgi:hypothetical protein